MAIQIYSEKSNRWRDAYNPLRGMNMPRLVSLLEAGERREAVQRGGGNVALRRNEHHEFAVDGKRFQISYTGGVAGNDVVLTYLGTVAVAFQAAAGSGFSHSSPLGF